MIKGLLYLLPDQLLEQVTGLAKQFQIQQVSKHNPSILARWVEFYDPLNLLPHPTHHPRQARTAEPIRVL